MAVNVWLSMLMTKICNDNSDERFYFKKNKKTVLLVFDSIFEFDFFTPWFPSWRFLCSIIRVLTTTRVLSQINTFEERVCKNNECYFPIRICSCFFWTNKSAGCLIESSVDITVNIHISKVSIIKSFLRKMEIENATKEEANNWE